MSKKVFDQIGEAVRKRAGTKGIEDRQPSQEFKQATDPTKGGLIPAMTNEMAIVYAKLLNVGCPPIRAVLYCAPWLMESEEGKQLAKKVAASWCADALVIEALSSINGGKWHELPMETRAKLAIEKNNAEAAFFLWSANFGDMSAREEIDKMKLARDILKGILGQQPDESDPMQAFARFALELVRNTTAQRSAQAKKPVQVEGDGLDKLLNQAQNAENGIISVPKQE